jgi:hypothetical protein
MSTLAASYLDRNTAASTLATVFTGAGVISQAFGQNASGADAYFQVWDNATLLYTCLAADKGTVLYQPPGLSQQTPGRPFATALKIGWSSTEHTFTGASGRFNVFYFSNTP